MDEVTQQNSALVEENAATAKTLEHQAKAMDEQVAFFQIAAGHDTHGYTSPPVARSPGPTKSIARTPGNKVVAVPATTSSGPGRSDPKRRDAAGAGPARNMRTALAKAINADDWKEF